MAGFSFVFNGCACENSTEQLFCGIYESGFVANCAQEVEKGQWPRSVEGLRGQGVEQCGRSEAFVSSLHDHLSFLDHVHEFDPDQSALSCLERFEPQHRPCHPLDCSMILLHDVVYVFHLTDADGGAVCLVVTLDAQFIGDCSSSKWSKHVTNSPFLARLARVGSSAAYKIISACSNAVS